MSPIASDLGKNVQINILIKASCDMQSSAAWPPNAAKDPREA